MQISKLDHVNLRTTQLDAMIEWYTKVLGLSSGGRPDFPFKGAWMYAGNTAVIHLVSIQGRPGIGSETHLKMEHFAFTATGRDEFEARLLEMGEAYHRVDLPSVKLIQINLWDPDRNHIHIDFASEE